MAENNWVLQDGRSILVEFSPAATATNWGWFGNRSSGEGLEFSTPETEWTNHAWLRGGQMVQAAEVGGATNYTLSCVVGAFNLTGNISNLLKGYRSVNTVGSYSLTGISNTLKRGYRIINTVGQYNLTGINNNLLYGRKLQTSVGSISLTGLSTTLARSYRMPTTVGTVSLNGINVNLLRGYRIINNVEAFNLTGINTTLTYSGGGPILNTLSETYRRRRRL